MPWKITDRLLLPIVFFLSAFAIALTLWQFLVSHRQAEIKAVTNEQLTFVRSKIESEWQERILPIQRLAERWAANPHRSETDMKSDASLLMGAYPEYQAMEWLDPSFHAQWIAPRVENDSAPRGIPSDAEQLAALAGTGSGISARLVNLSDGGKVLLARAPVYSKSKLQGYLVAVFRDQDLFASILQDGAQSYWVAVFDGNEEIYSTRADSAEKDADWAQSATFHLQQLNWRVQVWPKPGALSYALPLLPRIEFIGGILMAGLLAFTVYLAETARLHAREVAKTNNELTREIAVREQAEKALAEAQKMEAVGRLAGGMAHDFNNLLMVIRGHTELLQKGMHSQRSLRDHLNEILKSTERASSVTRHLLAFSRKQVLQLRVVDLNAVVSQVTELLPAVLGDNIELVTDLNADLGHVRADIAQMEQVIMNLVFNARDSMPDGGVLTIETTNSNLDEEWACQHQGAHAGPNVSLIVRDTGHGMDESVMSHIFEPFFTTKDRTKGTGLGLATVYGTLRQSGGCISVASTVGEGTAFQVHLPRVEEPLDEIEEPAAKPEPLVGVETILVVEDDDAVRRITREFLKLNGYNVIEAGSAESAIELVKLHKESIHLVLTDVLMPEMNGRALIERLEEEQPGIKVLYMSAYTEDAAINIGALEPGTQFIEKPFSPDELANKVRKALTRTSAAHG